MPSAGLSTNSNKTVWSRINDLYLSWELFVRFETQEEKWLRLLLPKINQLPACFLLNLYNNSTFIFSLSFTPSFNPRVTLSYLRSQTMLNFGIVRSYFKSTWWRQNIPDISCQCEVQNTRNKSNFSGLCI